MTGRHFIKRRRFCQFRRHRADELVGADALAHRDFKLLVNRLADGRAISAAGFRVAVRSKYPSSIEVCSTSGVKS